MFLRIGSYFRLKKKKKKIRFVFCFDFDNSASKKVKLARLNRILKIFFLLDRHTFQFQFFGSEDFHSFC